jgi:hypothetical protein
MNSRRRIATPKYKKPNRRAIEIITTSEESDVLFEKVVEMAKSWIAASSCSDMYRMVRRRSAP